MTLWISYFPIFLLISITLLTECLVRDNSTGEVWGYQNIRPQAFMFWWLYGQPKTTSAPGNTSRPLLMWLQGGPGASSTGFGNMAEIGPLDEDLHVRSSTWLKMTDLLFVDSPVGTGFSYVTDPDSYTTTEEQIGEDLFSFMKMFLKEMPEYQGRPFYIFGVSYGGKMAASFGNRLLAGIDSKDINCNFKGVVLGGSWISPVDSVANWAPFLRLYKLLDDDEFVRVSQMANATIDAVANKQFCEATELWRDTQRLIRQLADDVDLYHVLRHHVPSCNKQSTNILMNTQIRQKLQIIPPQVVWDQHRWDVFSYQASNFMQPAIDEVGRLLESNKIKVTVFQGQFDVVCDTPGAEAWLKKIPWSGLQEFLASPRVPLVVDGVAQGLIQRYGGLTYYLLVSGHMVPVDAPQASLEMLRQITSDN